MKRDGDIIEDTVFKDGMLNGRRLNNPDMTFTDADRFGCVGFDINPTDISIASHVIKEITPNGDGSFNVKAKILESTQGNALRKMLDNGVEFKMHAHGMGTLNGDVIEGFKLVSVMVIQTKD